jgi:S-(hydroxymethyl)glutathione dehydrogenase/alcohol dehydrogenase
MYSMAGLAEYSVVPATDVFPLPDALPLLESSVLGCAIFTAYGAIKNAADLRAGERIAVVAAGGVGLSIVQVARAFGASQVIAIDVRDDKLEMARQLGATHVVNAAHGDVVGQIRALTDGRGVDVAFEVLGRADTFVQAFEVVRDGGRMVVCGHYTDNGSVEINPHWQINRKHVELHGCWGARYEHFHRAVELVARFQDQKPWGAMVTGEYSLERAGEALSAIEKRTALKAIIRPS